MFTISAPPPLINSSSYSWELHKMWHWLDFHNRLYCSLLPLCISSAFLCESQNQCNILAGDTQSFRSVSSFRGKLQFSDDWWAFHTSGTKPGCSGFTSLLTSTTFWGILSSIFYSEVLLRDPLVANINGGLGDYSGKALSTYCIFEYYSKKRKVKFTKLPRLWLIL